MNLEGTVSGIIKKSPKFQKAIKRDPSVKKKLNSIVDNNLEDYSFLLSWAKFGDKVNSVVGPLISGLRYLSPLGSVGFGVYSLTQIAQYGLVKLPYLAYYTAKTGDLKGGLAQSAVEVAKYAAPFGSTADVYPLYQKSSEDYIVDKSSKSLDDYLATTDLEPRERKLSLIQDDVKVPLDLIRNYRAKVANGKLYLEAPSAGYELGFRSLGDGVHEVYVTQKKGVHPNVYTTMIMPIPKGTRELKFPEHGLLRWLKKAQKKIPRMEWPKPSNLPKHRMDSKAA